MKTPQQLSREAIEEFKAIYQEEFGKSLSDDEVQAIALRLLRFFGILHHPLPDETPDSAISPLKNGPFLKAGETSYADSGRGRCQQQSIFTQPPTCVRIIAPANSSHHQCQ